MNVAREVPPPQQNRIYGKASRLGKSDLVRIASSFSFPQDYKMRLPSQREGCAAFVEGGWIAVYEASLSAGLRFPLSSFGEKFLRDFHLAPAQIHPNGWLILVAFSILCQQRGVMASSELFSCFYSLRGVDQRVNFYSFQRVSGVEKLFVDSPSKVDSFESRWFALMPSNDFMAPRQWCLDPDRKKHAVKYPRPMAIRADYDAAIQKLVALGPIFIRDIMTQENIAAAGWGAPSGNLVGPYGISHDASVIRSPNNDDGPDDAHPLKDEWREGRTEFQEESHSHTSTPYREQVSSKEMGRLGDAIRRKKKASASSRRPQQAEGEGPSKRPQPSREIIATLPVSEAPSQETLPLLSPLPLFQLPHSSPAPPTDVSGSPMPHIVKSHCHSGSQCSQDVAMIEANPSSSSREHPRETHAECNMSGLPFRKDRRVLALEGKHTPIFPDVPLVQSRPVCLEDGRHLRGDHFQVCPGVIDTDSVRDPGIGARLIYSTILPPDEQDMFALNFPDFLDSPEREVIHGVQRMVVANARCRAYHQFMEERMNYWLKEQERWDEQSQHLDQSVREARQERESLREICQGLREQLAQIESTYADRDVAYADQVSTLEHEVEMLNQVCSALRSKTDQQFALSRAREEDLQRELEASRQQQEKDSARIRARAVREYRLSRDCFERKEEYAGGFVKLGFYLARSFLESKRPGESFDDLIFSSEVTENADSLDWRKYEPGAESPNTYLTSSLVDNLENLTGPWEPYEGGPGAPEQIGALSGLDINVTDDPTPFSVALALSPLPVADPSNDTIDP
ncbi:uncharacterized protein LOC127800829 [Diospyros lotus]|uniref:uncharacterized protein LOC127800829 n=1 Tax=Diospyros lotus TaxID=55363 RepID=UPI00225B0342|nr:uncharacterized protein LOC127800829 [Diospyros lotus]XP_052191630.1 uncharacterized protein LOC127800829 [Diospyros lotus]XP_052191631.1 uncharacterized protein LOC127800829 [Diospyros lotus]